MTPFGTDVCILAAVWLLISAASIAEVLGEWWTAHKARRKARLRIRWHRRRSLQAGVRQGELRQGGLR